MKEMMEDDGDVLREKCGLFGIYGHEKAAEVTYLGLFALQHRGEESAGIATSTGESLLVHKELGHVGEVFHPENLKRLKGNIAIGHVRYSTTGSTLLKNAQPIMVDYSRGQIAVAHNGNLVNAKKLHDELEAYGSIFASTVDSEIIVHLMARPQNRTREEGLINALRQIEGAYCFTILTEHELIGARDPHGFRPLCLGRLGNAYVLASETCAFDLIQADFIREIEPGEVVIINEHGVKSLHPFREEAIRKAFCIFEHVYFARPDSHIFGESVARVRERLGEMLAKEHPAEADLVIPVPDSGNFAALGYSRASGIPFAFGFTRNHYIGRTFILPEQAAREFKVRIKLNPLKEMIRGQRVIIVDDSIVRGNTARSRVRELRTAGAREVHMRVSCPPHRSPCYYGIDFPKKEELLANNYSMEEIKKFLDVESIGYLSEEGLLSAVTAFPKDHYCTACFTGKYPTPVEPDTDKFAFETPRRIDPLSKTEKKGG
jgi:amidophosphoribosyltransferase